MYQPKMHQAARAHIAWPSAKYPTVDFPKVHLLVAVGNATIDGYDRVCGGVPLLTRYPSVDTQFAFQALG
jgi:hypothetical protein